MAKIITVPETVTLSNIEAMKELIRKGEEYPGASYVTRPDGKKKRITNELKEEICTELVPGYKVERHIRDGDIVLFNRHPSLHKQSLMAHHVRVLPNRTFRLHPAAAAPYNADYDGDEMNIHSPQTEEARAEAQILLNVDANIISSKNNMNLVGTIADSITGAYLLGKSVLNKADADQLLYSAGLINSIKTKNIEGKDVFAQVAPKGTPIKFSPEITSSTAFGIEDGSLIKVIDKQFGRKEAVDSINSAFVVGAIYLSRKGYTLSLRDLTVSEKVRNMTYEVIDKVENKTDSIIKEYKEGTLSLIPGKTLEESRETRIMQVPNGSEQK